MNKNIHLMIFIFKETNNHNSQLSSHFNTLFINSFWRWPNA